MHMAGFEWLHHDCRMGLTMWLFSNVPTLPPHRGRGECPIRRDTPRRELPMLIRCARKSDASLAADVARPSITELCTADYRGDAQVLARWLANKTPEDFRRWIGSADRSVCVAIRAEGRLAAVSMVAWCGEILLNYVAPETRFLGGSKALVAHMEDHLRERGAERVALLSTHVARRFYCSIGYEEVGRMASRFGTLDTIGMAKRLW
jgi:GNAT superfamily N-acetyltransferase